MGEAETTEDVSLMYEVRQNSELGRYLVASRDIEPREIIIREEPLISGPSDRHSKEFPACLGCFCLMDKEPMNRCTNCRWPVCNKDCEKLAPHAENECPIFRKNRVVYPPPHGWPLINKCIIILRCLLLKWKASSEWKKLMNMSDNKTVRSGKPTCLQSDKRILENFACFFPNQKDNGNVSGNGSSAEDASGYFSEEVVQVSGIIDVNAHAFPLKVKERSTTVCNLYSRTSLMAHSCTPNASWCADKALSSLSLTIRANVRIEKGDMITVAYDEGQLLVCTLKRLVNDIHGMFLCKCRRCLSPTELGTYIGALKCPSCIHGYLLPENPVDLFSNWKCDNNKNDVLDTLLVHDGVTDNTIAVTELGSNRENSIGERCDAIFDDESITEIILDAESTCGYLAVDLALDPPQEDDGTLELLKEFVDEFSGIILHPNHYILQEVNVRIIKGDFAKGLNNLSDIALYQFLDRCDRLLKIADLLTPGYCEYRAFLQFHFSQGLLYLEKKRKGRKTKELRERHHKSKQQGEGNGTGTDNKVKQGPLTIAHNSGVAKKTENEVENDDAYGASMETMKSDTKYENSLTNWKRLREMLAFLYAYFKELNPAHSLLKPIKETLIESEMKLKTLEKLD